MTRRLPLRCRLALALYPPRFRERYGAELAQLMEELPPTAPVARDLFSGSLRAWSRLGEGRNSHDAELRR
ncbi:MAG: hypothetical protein ACREN4_07910 [Candidatus Dormibacteria bacterium]